MRFFHQAFVACITINRKYQTKIILVIHVLEFRKIFCMRKLQGISGRVKGYKSAVSGVKKIFMSSLKGYLAVLIPVALNSVV
ncbi:hypothetical protein H3S89_10805 [Bartonella sp. B10834G6]|uniref:hypothetical protein n=1 Tax=Bartonella apis TaxID=1686310 RepID=UPI0018DDB484|nr:hypothetical protein [Bartonella apis]MBH9983273.1 hypothetical protein [Bartonella apis]